MNIGIDFDGVLSNPLPQWQGHVHLHAERHGHAGHFALDTYRALPDLCAVCYVECCANPDYVTRSAPMWGAEDALAALAGHTLTLVTSRAQEQASVIEAWLERHHLSFSRLVFGARDKTPWCRALRLDVLVDDAPHNLLPLLGGDTTPLCFDRPYNRSLEGIARADSWPAVVATITERMTR